jgi:hypothetical protein
MFESGKLKSNDPSSPFTYKQNSLALDDIWEDSVVCRAILAIAVLILHLGCEPQTLHDTRNQTI